MGAGGTVGRAVGRRPGEARAREAILAASRRCFAEQGYAGTSIRKIAREADVDHTLVIHFFGTKDALFSAVLHSVPILTDLIREASDGGPADLGRRLVRGYLECWEDPDNGRWLRVVVQAALSSPGAAAALSAFITHEVMALPADQVDSRQAELRANLAGAQLLGMAMARFVLRTEPLASADQKDVITHLAPLIQRCLTGDVADSATEAQRPAVRKNDSSSA